ncbi:pollen receptor-like kinase 4 [Prosopis cineraria]|uniref:pollen receptor-like kinase 4 n=1 Tax=Prosopis cineraria TaxID=364024 RepID=UPI00240F0155|nr:pollen receptor-like kinase 4 [Prosopis cineraria]
MAYHKAYRGLLIMLLAFVVAVGFLQPSLGDDAQVLIKFKSFLSNAGALNNWNDSISICDWNGVRCRKGGIHLKLEKMGLSGTIDIDTLLELSNLQSVSVKDNNFEGKMPSFNRIGRLKGLYLSHNKFSGDIPDNAFEGMKYLSKVYLDENEFTGHIPSSLAELPNLLDLDLHSNRFEGNIPEFRTKNKLRLFNLSNNLLEGEIPGSANVGDPSAYEGNKGLCGKPLNNPCKKSSRKRDLLITAIVVVAVIFLASILAATFVVHRRRRRRSQMTKTTVQQVQHQNSAPLVIKKEEAPSLDLTAEFKTGENGDLNFVKRDAERFDLQDLLRASAEVLGSGSFGSTYKAIVLNGPAVVVKRFKHMNNLGKEEFSEHMRRLGSLSHPNLLPLVAFHFRKEEKLLVYEFVENGSLASHLHGRHGSGLDWPTRLKITKGVARGLAYLYREFPDQKLSHGHLKSSNVLLDQSMEPRLTEYGLVPVMNKSHAQQFMAAYKAPEVNQLDRPNQKTDVWCLGILILELLTGKFPANYLRHGKGGSSDLATWVNSVVREEWTGEVFDKDILGTRNGEGEMLKLLKIGMYCCEWDVENRWDWKETVAKIEELKEKDSEDDFSSFNNSEADFSSRPMTDEDLSFTAPN